MEMLELRYTTPIDKVEKKFRDLWVWFAMSVATYTFPDTWGDKDKRKKEMMHLLLTITDEAFVLQICIIRGPRYLAELTGHLFVVQSPA